MAFKHGRIAAIYFNSKDASGYFNDASISIDTDTADTSTFGNTFKTFVPGMSGATASFSGFYDPDYTDPIDNLRVDNGVLSWAPAGGTAVGDYVFMLPVTGTSLGISTSTTDAVAVAWDVLAQGAVTLGQVLHVLGEDTNTTTGASKDDAAATSTGWTAHLHVTAVDAGSWVVKVQDSADNSSWADVTNFAFTAATTATYERIQSATATATLRRYVRYVATRTGGTAGDGITFALTYSRA